MNLLFLVCCNAPKREDIVVKELPAIEKKVGFTPKERVFEALPDYDTDLWTERLSDSTHLVDIRYATVDNFMKEIIYDCGRCFLRPAAADSLSKVVKSLESSGYGVILYDCYRPLPAQQKLWNMMPNAMYVTPPSKGSMHNRGHAVDVGLIDINTREVLDMGTEFDYFGKEAHFAYPGLEPEVSERRQLLRRTMEKYGFSGIRTEWWHFSLKKNVASLSDWEWECE